MKRIIRSRKGSNKRFMTVWVFLVMIVWMAIWVTGRMAMAAETADELYLEGKFEEAEKRYAEGDMDHPKDIRYRYNRGCAAYQKGDLQSATAAFASVLRRTDEKETRFRAAYNLGNVAFKQGDFVSAVAAYKQALLIRPEAEDARYNLELALREMDKQEKQKKEQEQQPPQKQEGKKGDGSKGDQKEKQQEKKEQQGEKSESQDKQSPQDKQGPDESKEKGEAKQDQKEPSDGGQAKQEEKDLSGELAPMKPMEKESGQKPETQPETSAAMMDRKKAEALLDNVKEDRSRFLQYQLSKEKRRGPQSGKDW